MWQKTAKGAGVARQFTRPMAKFARKRPALSAWPTWLARGNCECGENSFRNEFFGPSTPRPFAYKMNVRVMRGHCLSDSEVRYRALLGV